MARSSPIHRRYRRARAVRIADLSDPALKERIAELKATRDQAQVDAERATIALENVGQTITPDSLRRFAQTARHRMRGPEGGYRRDHLRALAQRVEVADGEVRIMGSRSELLRTLAAASGVRSAGPVRSSVPKWRAMLEEDEHYAYAIALR